MAHDFNSFTTNIPKNLVSQLAIDISKITGTILLVNHILLGQ